MNWFDFNRVATGLVRLSLVLALSFAGAQTDDAPYARFASVSDATDGRVAMLDASVLAIRRVGPESGGLAIVREPWGRVEIEFTDCDLAVMSWERDLPGFESDATLIRKTNPGGRPGCSTRPPESALIPAWYYGPESYFRLFQ